MNTYKFIAHTLNVKPRVHTAHSHEILFTTHTYLTFVFSLINTDSRNAAVDPLVLKEHGTVENNCGLNYLNCISAASSTKSTVASKTGGCSVP